MTIGLTKRQDEVLRFLCAYQAQHGTMPTFEEIADALNLGNKSNVSRVLNALEERQFIRRLPHRARAIEILIKPIAVPVGSDTLSPSLQSKLAAFCAQRGENPADVLHDAILLHIDSLEARLGV